MTVTMKNTILLDVMPYSLGISLLTLQSNMLLPHLGSKRKSRKQKRKKQAVTLLLACFLDLLFNSEMEAVHSSEILINFYRLYGVTS